MSKATVNGAQFVVILFEALLIVGRRCCLPEKTPFSTLVYMTRCTHDRRFVALPHPTFVAVVSIIRSSELCSVATEPGPG